MLKEMGMSKYLVRDKRPTFWAAPFQLGIPQNELVLTRRVDDCEIGRGRCRVQG
jgi:hypothetical protein